MFGLEIVSPSDHLPNHAVSNYDTRLDGDRMKKNSRNRIPKRESGKPVGVGEVLASLKKTTKLGRRLQEAQIWQNWPSLAGPRLATKGHPVSVRDRTLYVEAYSPVWMNQFAYHKYAIIRRINRMAQCELISDIFIQLQQDASENECRKRK